MPKEGSGSALCRSWWSGEPQLREKQSRSKQNGSEVGDLFFTQYVALEGRIASLPVQGLQRASFVPGVVACLGVIAAP